MQDQGLLERDFEASAIARVYSEAEAGRGAMLVVEGPAGIGKTSVIAAGLATAGERGMRVLRARAAELERNFAFGVARQLFERPLAALGTRQRERVLAGAAGASAELVGLAAGGPDLSVDAAAHSLYWLTSNLSALGPLAISIDDAQWSDGPSLRFLAFLARRLEDLPVALLIGLRSPEQRSPNAVLESLLPLARFTLRPAPLTDAAVADLAVRTLGTTPDPAFVAACEQSTGGNALYVTELLRTLADENVDPSADSVPSVVEAAPDAVRRRVTAVLAGLPETSRRFAHALAILGEAELATVAALAELDAAGARRAARSLDEAGLLAPGRMLRFTHPVIANAVESSLADTARSDAHTAAARLLAGAGAPLDTAAAHLLETRPARDPWVVTTLRDAARAAFSRGGAEEAAAFLLRALEEPPDRELALLLLELGLAEQAIGDLDAAAEFFHRALGAKPDRATEDALRIALSNTLFLSGDFDGATQQLLEARPTPKDEARTRLFDGNLMALCLLDPDRLGLVDDRLERYRQQEAAGKLDDPVLLTLVGGLSVIRGDPVEEGLPLVERALELGLTAFGDDTFAFGWAAVSMLASDRSEEMLAYIDDNLAEARRRGDAMLTAYVLSYRTYAVLSLGYLAEAEATGYHCIELLPGQEALIHFPFSLLDVLVERDKLPDAEVLLASLPDTGSPQRDAIVRLMRGRVALAGGRFEEALPPLLQAGEELSQINLHHPRLAPWRAHAAAAAAALGDVAHARRLAGEELALSRRTGATTAQMQSLRAVATADPERAVEALAEACALGADVHDLLERAACRTAYGRALLEAGRTADAREELRLALAVAHEAGALRLADEARRELVAAGGRPRRAALAGVDALTPSELQVARQAAEGRTNREIAEALFVTLKTVERHLNRAYAKLGIAGRPELAPAMQKRVG